MPYSNILFNGDVGQDYKRKPLKILEFEEENTLSYEQLLLCGGDDALVLAVGDIPYSDADSVLQEELSCLSFPGKFTHWVALCSVSSMTSSNVVIVEHFLLGGRMALCSSFSVSACWRAWNCRQPQTLMVSLATQFLQKCRKLLLYFFFFSGKSICYVKNTKGITGYKFQAYSISFLLCPCVLLSLHLIWLHGGGLKERAL